MSISFTTVPTPEPPPGHDPSIRLEVKKQPPPGEIDISVKKENWVDISKHPTDFPDSDGPDGFSMICLENALIDRYAQYAEDKGLPFDKDNAGDREHALKLMKQGIYNVHSSLLKQGDRVDSPVLAETYTKTETIYRHESQGALQVRIQEKKARGEKLTMEEKWNMTQRVKEEVDKTFYKFHVTWEIELTLPDGSKDTLSKTQWVKTGVSLPKPAVSPSITAESQHAALLAIKTHRHVHKAALNPRHIHYESVKGKVEYLKCNDIISATSLNTGVVRFGSQKSFGLTEGAPAHYTKIRLDGNSFYIKHGREGRKLRVEEDKKAKTTYTKWEKTTLPSSRNPQAGVTTQAHKLYTQASSMIVKDPALQELDEWDDLSPEELTRRYSHAPDPSVPVSARGRIEERPPLSLLDQIKRDKEHLEAFKESFDTDESKLRTGLLEIMEQSMTAQGLIGEVGAFGVGVGALFAEKQIVGKMVEKLAGQFQTSFESWQAGTGPLPESYGSIVEIRSKIIEIEATLKEIEQFEQRIVSLDKLHASQAILQDRILGEETKDILLSHLEAREAESPPTTSSTTVQSRQEKLAIYQPILDLKASLEVIENLQKKLGGHP